MYILECHISGYDNNKSPLLYCVSLVYNSLDTICIEFHLKRKRDVLVYGKQII